MASQTNDWPVPKYQNIIDPNLCVRERSEGSYQWVPSEFDVSKNGTVTLVGGDRAHWMGQDLVNKIATPVLAKAIPLLAKLRKPYLLLEEQRLQVAIKAQRIELSRKRSKNDVSDYIGLWHVDGDEEPVVAVVLYYYGVDARLEGGSLEFIDRRPLEIVSSGDCSNTIEEFGRDPLKKSLRNEDKPIANCIVPTKTGTLLVFSNYQMAHRVLRMVNNGTTPAAREFVALFIMDPASEPLVPARCHLANPYLYQRALCGPRSNERNALLTRGVAHLILEFTGVVSSTAARKRLRNQLMRKQLQPRGQIGYDGGRVCCLGNGCFQMIGWIDQILGIDPDTYDEEVNAAKRSLALNNAPQQIGRGLSETLSIPTADLELDIGTAVPEAYSRVEDDGAEDDGSVDDGAEDDRSVSED